MFDNTPPTSEELEKRERIGCIGGFIMWVMLLVLLFLMYGCSPKITQPQPKDVRIDTVYVAQHSRDSIFVHDSIYVSERQKGDTIYLTRDRWHTQYIEQTRLDTIYELHTDTIVRVEVRNELTKWQTFETRLCKVLVGMIIFFVLLAVALYFLRRYLVRM